MPALASSLRVLEARDRYLAENGLTIEGYTAPTFTLRFLGIPVTFPSTANRKRALPLHDLHHILTGYETDWAGEAQIGAWELRAGCNSPVLYWLNGWGVVFGLFLAPLRTWRAFRSARGQHSLYRDPTPYASLLEMTVGELRARLGIPAQGLASGS